MTIHPLEARAVIILGAFAAFCLLVTTCGACVAPRVTAPAPRPVAVYITSACAEGGSLVARHGSGVALSTHTVITAAHVAPCDNPGLVVDGRPATVLRVFAAHDLALLHTSAPLTVTSVTITPPHAGRVCFASAAPARGWHCGVVTRMFADRFYHTAPTVPGNSGSGVYDVDGRLVGIVTNRLGVGVGGFARPLVLETVPLGGVL